MDRVLRTILHRPIQLMFLLLLPIAIGGAIAYRQPHQYQATATILALHHYDTLTATNVDSANLATPAESQATALADLLQSRSFALAVAQEAHLVNSQRPDDALLTDISQHVQVQAQGYNLFTISYMNTDPQIARQVVAAVVDNYRLETQRIASEGQNALGAYQTQLARAYRDWQNAVAAESQYMQSHPGQTQTQLQNDPTYQQLHAQTQQAQLIEQGYQTSFNTLQQEINTHTYAAANLFNILDEPVIPSTPVSRLKLYLLGAGTGLAIGLLASIVYIILAARRDRRVYNSLDLQKVTAYPVLMELPRLSTKTVAQLVKTAAPPDFVISNGRVNNSAHYITSRSNEKDAASSF